MCRQIVRIFARRAWQGRRLPSSTAKLLRQRRPVGTRGFDPRQAPPWTQTTHRHRYRWSSSGGPCPSRERQDVHGAVPLLEHHPTFGREPDDSDPGGRWTISIAHGPIFGQRVNQLLAAIAKNNLEPWEAISQVREVVQAIFYILSTGCQWTALTGEFPPHSTVTFMLDETLADGMARTHLCVVRPLPRPNRRL
ncbi:transposase [Bradyrhizobium cytisi]|uniref:Transposase n=1 Tax=Bradyrhizobium cytisi TaxID=515489 RepID=A0A5S4VZA4_9BRAD|nr:transposase [Bradyrhizobium cytisi]